MGCCQKKKSSNIENTDIAQSMINTKNLESKSDQDVIEEIGNENLEEIEKITYDDFEPLKLLGTGSFGRVLLVRLKRNNKLYAMKVLSKTFIKKRHQEEHTKTERDLMVKINSPFVINIKFAFQDISKLYIVTEFMQGGDMFFHLHEIGKFNDERAKFYFIELTLALEFLHKNNMVYRDLKPENILMDSEGHIKIADFGLSKILDSMDDTAYTLCGTPQYLAPEVLKKKGYNKNVDWWSLGVFLYEMLTGNLPFNIPKGAPLDIDMFTVPLKFPKGINKQAKDLIKKLLNTDPEKRLGTGLGDAKNVKLHSYFKGLNWDDYQKKLVKPPYTPQFSDELDLKYFDKMFTEEDISSGRTTMLVRSRGPSTYQNFTYTAESLREKKEGKKEGEEEGEGENTEEKNDNDDEDF